MLLFFVFDDLYFVDLVVVDLVLCLPRFIVFLWFFLLALILIFSVLTKRLTGKSIVKITYLLLNLN